jgi:O-antigen ligase
MWVVIAAAVIVTPLVVTPSAFDPFRTPKDVVFLCAALALLPLLIAGALWSDDFCEFFRVRQPALIVAVMAVVWTAIASMTSLLPLVSRTKPLQVLALAILFAATLIAAHDRKVDAVLVALVPAVVNAIVAVLQSTGTWSPWPSKLGEHGVWTTALIGNPNEAGSWFVFPLLTALAAAVAWRRWWLAVLAAFVGAGLVSAQSISPILAAIAGVITLAFVIGSRRMRILVLVGAVALGFIAVLHPANRDRMARLRRSLSSGQLPELTSYRIVPAFVAWTMFLERPLLGVGPGVFSARYMDYKLRADEARPLWIREFSTSFGETHNDHLQILAETGLPGYAIFVVALVLLASRSFLRGPPRDDRQRFARIFGLPAAVTLGVLALAQFPLQLTAPMVMLVYLSALCFTWTRRDETR